MRLLRYLLVSFFLSCSANAIHPETSETVLQQADYFADRYHWEKASPLYAEAERRLAEAGDAATATYCKIARVRASANAQPDQQVYDALNKEINRAPFHDHPWLRLKALFFRANLETEIDPISVRAFDAKQRRRHWEEILSLARQLRDSHFESRARGELGLVNLLEGDVTGSDEIGSALWQAKDSGDFLNEFRFRLAVSALFLAAGRHHDALGHMERAIDLAENHELPSFGGSPHFLTREPSVDTLPSWSRDGRWIYFGSDQSGEWQIWKVGVDEGKATQITQTGGVEAFESLDGQFLYFTKPMGLMWTFGLSSIWTLPTNGGEEVRVVERTSVGYWGLLKDGLCYLDAGGDLPFPVQYLNFATGQIRKIGSIDKEPIWNYSSFSVSPDGRWILYTRRPSEERDLMLVEDFH